MRTPRTTTKPRYLTLPIVVVLGVSSVSRADPPLGSAIDYLTVAQIAARRGEWMTAERIVRDGLVAHPESDGFHLGLGYVLEHQGRIADAFYEYQWEIVRASNARLVKEATRKMALLLERDDAEEPRRVLAAMELAKTDPIAARRVLAAITTKGARPFALRLFETECAKLAGDLAAAEAGFRELIAIDEGFAAGRAGLAQVLDEAARARRRP